MLNFLIENAWRVIATLVFLWTLLNIYIAVRIDPDFAPKWATFSMVAWLVCWVLALIVAVIGYIWTY